MAFPKSYSKVFIQKKYKDLFFYFNNFLHKLSISVAPSGAETKIATTATVKIIGPQDNPIDKAIPPIDAWTVALGKYAIIVKMRSLNDRFVLIKQINTPIVLKANPTKSINNATKLLFIA